jgi:hypothetical protein
MFKGALKVYGRVLVGGTRGLMFEEGEAWVRRSGTGYLGFAWHDALELHR